MKAALASPPGLGGGGGKGSAGDVAVSKGAAAFTKAGVAAGAVAGGCGGGGPSPVGPVAMGKFQGAPPTGGGPASEAAAWMPISPAQVANSKAAMAGFASPGG